MSIHYFVWGDFSSFVAVSSNNGLLDDTINIVVLNGHLEINLREVGKEEILTFAFKMDKFAVKGDQILRSNNVSAGCMRRCVHSQCSRGSSEDIGLNGITKGLTDDFNGFEQAVSVWDDCFGAGKCVEDGSTDLQQRVDSLGKWNLRKKIVNYTVTIP